MCSKMSQLYAEVMEHANEMGFETLEEAEQAGFMPNYATGKLEKVGYDDTPAWCKRLENYDEEQRKAHETWLKERDDILDDLEHLKNIYKEVKPDEDIIERTINFVKKGEC